MMGCVATTLSSSCTLGMVNYISQLTMPGKDRLRMFVDGSPCISVSSLTVCVGVLVTHVQYVALRPFQFPRVIELVMWMTPAVGVFLYRVGYRKDQNCSHQRGKKGVYSTVSHGVCCCCCYCSH